MIADLDSSAVIAGANLGVLIHGGYCPDRERSAAIFYLTVGLGFDANASALFAYNRRLFEPHLASQ
jgi:hypothetical protein